MKVFVGFLATLAFLPGCQLEQVAVGTGNPISSVTTPPSGNEFYAAFEAAIGASLDAANGPRGEIQGSHVYQCSGGGQASQITSQAVTVGGPGGVQEGSATSHATLQNCAVVITLGGGTFAETITGTSKIAGSLKSGTFKGAILTRYTVSGDLGFAVECTSELSTQPPANTILYNLPTTMECSFSDGTDSIVSSVADTFQNDVSLPMPPE